MLLDLLTLCLVITCKSDDPSSVTMAMRNVKCVCIGDGAVGKTCLLMSYSQGKSSLMFIPHFRYRDLG